MVYFEISARNYTVRVGALLRLCSAHPVPECLRGLAGRYISNPRIRLPLARPPSTTQFTGNPYFQPLPTRDRLDSFSSCPLTPWLAHLHLHLLTSTYRPDCLNNHSSSLHSTYYARERLSKNTCLHRPFGRDSSHSTSVSISISYLYISPSESSGSEPVWGPVRLQCERSSHHPGSEDTVSTRMPNKRTPHGEIHPGKNSAVIE